MMSMPNWERVLPARLTSLPFSVSFAGFKSDTLTLAKAGWQFSIRQQVQVQSDELLLQVAMRLGTSGSGGVYAITRPLMLDYGTIYQCAGSDVGLMDFLKGNGLEVWHIGRDIQFQIQPIRGPSTYSFKDQFLPMDPYPQEYKMESLADFKFFKTGNPKIEDLIVSPRDVPELLTLIQKAQKPLMDDIKKRERSRANWAAKEAGFDLRPSHEVEARIVTLT